MEAPRIAEITPGAFGYPEALAALGTKAPTLSVMGNIDLLTKPGIGFCGSRKASDRGLDVAADCADQAAAMGFSVVSGNAAGVDAVAHGAALAAGGDTILVLPEGFDYFRIRKDLRPHWDWERVLVVSQFERNARWQAYRAMSRNQVIIALSKAMVVIEAGTTGGTWNAGVSTLQAGKPLFVAIYDHAATSADGNPLLIDKGGVPLSRSRATGRANVEKIRLAATQLEDHTSIHARHSEQLSLI